MRCKFANGDDTVIVDSDGSICDDIASGVHGGDGGVGEKHENLLLVMCFKLNPNVKTNERYVGQYLLSQVHTVSHLQVLPLDQDDLMLQVFRPNVNTDEHRLPFLLHC